MKPIALKCVFDLYQAFPHIPIIGTGGVTTGRDALEMIMAGATTTQNLSSTDCAGTSDRFEDRFWLVLMDGETVTLTLSSRHFTPYLRLLHNGEVVDEADGAVTGPATLTFTSNEFTAYDVHASSTEPQRSGEYTLFISRGAPASPRVARPGQFRGLVGIGAGIGVGTRGLESRPSGSPR